MQQSLDTLVADARAALGSAGQAMAPKAGEAPRYELFNAANSICSQKVRSVLAHHRLPYVSHSVKLFEGQTYLPDYVRLRMVGCGQLGGALASHHSGSTSTAAGGCDGAVVPTLVDWQENAVVVDSRRTCLYIDAQMGEADRLYPADLAPAIDEELAIVDNLPNYQLLMGRKVAESENAATRTDVGGTFSKRKVAWCDRFLQEYAGDATLVQAYTAKRAKELSAANELFSPEAMRAAYDRADSALQIFERKLERRAGPWLFGHAVTMADLFWGIELLRMKNMGVATFWEAGRLPQVAGFSAATEALASIRTAVIEWPGAMF